MPPPDDDMPPPDDDMPPPDDDMPPPDDGGGYDGMADIGTIGIHDFDIDHGFFV